MSIELGPRFINYVQTMECYPTCARVSGMNFCTVFSTVLSIFTPSVVFLVSKVLIK